MKTKKNIVAGLEEIELPILKIHGIQLKKFENFFSIFMAYVKIKY